MSLSVTLRACAVIIPAWLMCSTLAAQDSGAKAGRKSPPEKVAVLELPVPEADLKETTRIWYGVYLNGKKTGWGVESMGPATVDGKACISTIMELTMEIKALDNVMKMEMVSREHYAPDAPHRAFLIEDIQKMDGQERKVELRHKSGTTYSANITEAGRTRTEEVPDVDLRLSHSTTPGVWAADPSRQPGDAIGMIEFSADRMKTGRHTVTLERQADWAGPGGKLPVWEAELYDHDHRMGAAARVSRADGKLVSFILGRLIEVRMEPEKVAKHMPGEDQPDFFLATSIATDRKLGRSARLSELVIELSAPEGVEVPEIPNTVNQSAAREGGRVIVRVTPGAGKPQPAAAEDRAECLKATPQYPIGEESVRKLAAKAVAGAESEHAKVKRLLRFTDNYIRDSYEVEALTVMDILQSKRGDCSAHALLFTALARAAGIPAREASGWMYMGDDYKAFGGHAWNEVILDGHWVPVDAVWTQIQLDAGHIQHHSGDADGRVIEGFVTGLKAKVISVRKGNAAK